LIWKIGDIAPHLLAAENVDKEISEEANLSVKAHKLYVVRHKANHADTPDIRAFHNV